jgi:hypothetical protein
MAAGSDGAAALGSARHYDLVITVKAPVSARFLSEDERITIADLHRRGHTIRDIGTRLGPGTVHGQPGTATQPGTRGRLPTVPGASHSSVSVRTAVRTGLCIAHQV